MLAESIILYKHSGKEEESPIFRALSKKDRQRETSLWVLFKRRSYMRIQWKSWLMRWYWRKCHVFLPVLYWCIRYIAEEKGDRARSTKDLESHWGIMLLLPDPKKAKGQPMDVTREIRYGREIKRFICSWVCGSNIDKDRFPFLSSKRNVSRESNNTTTSLLFAGIVLGAKK